MKEKVKGHKLYDEDTELFYQLIYENPEHPILEISGIRMQEGDPVETGKTKVGLLKVREGMKVLEICTGLGYCTHQLVKRNCIVKTVEFDSNVIEMARHTKHFKEVEEKVEIVMGDGFEVVQELAEQGEKFDRILHDPPRFTRAPELYSQIFYNNVHKIMAKDGVFVHYVGNPYSKNKKRSFIPGIIQRLRNAGFKKIEHIGYNLVIKN